MTNAGRATLKRWTYDAWPADVAACFDGTRLAERADFAVSLAVIDDDAKPPEVRTALLSVGELFAPDARTLVFSLWPASRAARALHRHGRAALAFVAGDAFHQAQLQVRSSGTTGDALAWFASELAGGEAQRVGYARLTSGIRFALDDDARPAVLERWARQVDALKLAAAGR